MQSFNNAIETIKSVRQSYQLYEDKIRFSKESKKTYSQGIKSLIKFNKDLDDQKYLKRFFAFLEESYANTLKESSNINTTQKISQVPKSVLKSLKDLKIGKSYFISQVINEKSNNPQDLSLIHISEPTRPY